MTNEGTAKTTRSNVKVFHDWQLQVFNDSTDIALLSETDRRTRLMRFAGQVCCAIMVHKVILCTIITEVVWLAGQNRQKQTAKQKEEHQPGSLYKCNTYEGIFRGIQRYLRVERIKVFRETGKYPYPELDMFNKNSPDWAPLVDQINASLKR